MNKDNEGKMILEKEINIFFVLQEKKKKKEEKDPM